MIRLSKASTCDLEIEAITRVFKHQFFGMGPEVKLFEDELAKLMGRPVACVVNGTAALHLALQAAGVSNDDEVLVQSLTYVASYQAISACGAKPVACDIDPTTLTIDLSDAEKRLSSKTKAIMPVHYAGNVGDIDALYSFAQKHNLRIVEDAAHAFGSTVNGELVGSFGDTCCFSFDGIKNITSGEGGCVVSNDERLLGKVRDARLLGVQNDSRQRAKGNRSWQFDVVEQGWRYHMSDIMASVGRVQLGKLDDFCQQRRKHAERYNDLLAEVAHLELFDFYRDDGVVPHIYVVKLEKSVDRDLLRKQLLELDIQTGIHYFPNHQLTLYRSNEEGGLPSTDLVYPALLSLPFHVDLTDDDIKFVCDQLENTLGDLVN
jgi:dTDP-4-amino-4,6-dideoxygalactose transaminase